MVSSRRRAVSYQTPEDVPELGSASWVEASGGLVEEQHRWGGDETHGKVQTPPHPARVRLGDPITGVTEGEPVQELVGDLEDVGERKTVQPPDQPDVLPAGEQLVDGRGLPGRGPCSGGPLLAP